MHRLLSALRVLIASFTLTFAGLAFAQDPAPPAAADAPWQATITGQIEAFRQGDAPVAFSFAGEQFQKAFPSAMAFMQVIAASGYTPIFLSESHSFGKFQLAGDKEVLQVVKFVGPHQELYDAVYDLVEEQAGWKVKGVMLGKPAGIGV